MYRKVVLAVLVSLLGAGPGSAFAQGGEQAQEGSEDQSVRRGSESSSRLGGYSEVTEAGRVPEHLYNIVLGQPTNESIVASLVAHWDMEAYIEYGPAGAGYTGKTDVEQVISGQPLEFLMDGLEKDRAYSYQLRYRLDGEDAFAGSGNYAFHTPRSFGADFVFTVQADSHLDENTSAQIYTNALTGALESSPDFHLALGDTFMTDKYVEYELSEPQYLAQRYYFGFWLTHSSPLFFALGNHDAESANNEERTAWSTATRNKYFPNPAPNAFYSGNPDDAPEGPYVRNYYSFEWGNSQFIALDPFRNSPRRDRTKNDNWYMTLGKEQYDWLVKTLEESDATFKFVYLHNLVGGGVSNRGGAEASVYFEWGGHEFDGTYTFDKMRPGWGKPIHEVLVENNVSIVFHGHDHMYIQQDRDDIVYQLVPQPGHASGNANNAQNYGYLTGDVVKGSGHLRVAVSDDQVQVDFVDSRLDTNGDLLHSYVVKPQP